MSAQSNKRLKVLFCGRDMHFGYVFTAEALSSDPDIDVIQCDRQSVPLELETTDVVVPLMTPLPANILHHHAPNLKLVLQFGAGVEGVDAGAATELGIWLSNIPSAGTGNAVSCAEMAIYLTLATLRDPFAMSQSIQNQTLGVPLGDMLSGKTVLIVGFGNIAKETICRLQAFGVSLLALRRNNHWGTHTDSISVAAESVLEDKGIWPQDVSRLAPKADIIIITCHQDAANKGFINSDFLSHCKPNVRLINIARGGLIDYEAAKQGLESGEIGAMGLDVQWEEPIDPGDWMVDHPRVYLTPHVAGVTKESYRVMAEIVAREVRRIKEGKEPSRKLNQPLKPRHFV